MTTKGCKIRKEKGTIKMKLMIIPLKYAIAMRRGDVKRERINLHHHDCYILRQLMGILNSFIQFTSKLLIKAFAHMNRNI